MASARVLDTPGPLPRSGLSLRVRGARAERARRDGAPAASAHDLPATSARAGEYLLGVDLEVEGAMHPVTRGLAEYWGGARVFRAAAEAGCTAVSLTRLEAGVWAGESRATAPMLLLARALPPDIDVDGPAVLLAPTADTVYVTGHDDADGLAAIAERAARGLDAQPDEAVSAQPLVWRGQGWEPAPWPEIRGLARRARARRLAGAVETLRASFDHACAHVAQTAPSRGTRTADLLGYRADDSVLEAWTEIGLALGLSTDDAWEVVDCARDTLAYADAHDLSRLGVPRHLLRPQHVLADRLRRAGVLVSIDRRSDPRLVAEALAATPAARAAGARIAAPADTGDPVALAEALAATIAPYGLALGSFAPDADLEVFAVRDDAARALWSAAGRTGQDVVVPL